MTQETVVLGRDEIEVQFRPNEKTGGGIVGNIVEDHLFVETDRRAYDCDFPDDYRCWKRGYCNVCDHGILTSRKQRLPAHRSKIVFLHRDYDSKTIVADGVHGDIWLCRVYKDTLPNDPRRGALIVTPLKNLSLIDRQMEVRDRELLAPILDLGCSFTDACKINQGFVGKSHTDLIALRKKGPLGRLNENGRIYNEAWRLWIDVVIQRKAPPGNFTRISRTREFRCSHCNVVEKVGRVDMRNHENQGADLTIVCSCCFAKQTLKGEQVRGEPVDQYQLTRGADRLRNKFET